MNIVGKSECTAEQMAQYILMKNSKIDRNYVLELAQIYLEEGEAEGIRADGGWIQLSKETSNLKFDNGTAVTIDQNNFCGLGVTKKGMKGHSFATPRLGARAHIQHLHAYATKVPLNNPRIDPRYLYVSRGCAPTFELLTGKWSVPGYSTKLASSLQDAMNKGIGYGFDIINGINNIKAIKVDESLWVVKDPIIVPESTSSDTKYYRVQIGAYSVKDNAVKRVREAESKGLKAIIKESGGFYFVQIGAYSQKQNAENALSKIKTLGYPTAFIKYF